MCYAHSAFEHSLNSLQNSKGQDAELQGSGSDSLQELQGSGLQGPRSEAGRCHEVSRVTFVSNSLSFLFDFGRPITLLSPKNMPGTHQYAVTLVAQIVAQIFGLFWKSLLVDKVSWYMRFFLILPNKYYTFVTSPVLSASPSPAPFCSIFGSPNRLDLWLDLCLKLLFDCQKKLEGDKRCCE